MKVDKSSIAHTTWNYKYQIVFAPKYRRQVIYEKIKADIRRRLEMQNNKTFALNRIAGQIKGSKSGILAKNSYFCNHSVDFIFMA